MQMMLFSCKEAKKERKTKNDVDRPGLQVLAVTHTHERKWKTLEHRRQTFFFFFVAGRMNVFCETSEETKEKRVDSG